MIPPDFARYCAFHYAAGGEVLQRGRHRRSSSTALKARSGARVLLRPLPRRHCDDPCRRGRAVAGRRAGQGSRLRSSSKGTGSSRSSRRMRPISISASPRCPRDRPARQPRLHRLLLDLRRHAGSRCRLDGHQLPDRRRGHGQVDLARPGDAVPSAICRSLAGSSSRSAQPFIAGGEYARGWQLGVGGQPSSDDANAELQGLFAGEQDVADDAGANPGGRRRPHRAAAGALRRRIAPPPTS